jgi:hypothetical protein
MLITAISLRTFAYEGPFARCRKRNNGPKGFLEQGSLIMIKLQAFRIAVSVSTLAMVIAASGAGQKWAH